MVDKYEDPFVKISAMIGGDEYLKVARSLLKTEDATDEEIASSNVSLEQSSFPQW